MASRARRFAWFAILCTGAALHAAVSSCGVSKAGPPEGATRAMPVQVVEAKNGPVEDTAEYVATMDSRRAVELMPQVEGFVTRI